MKYLNELQLAYRCCSPLILGLLIVAQGGCSASSGASTPSHIIVPREIPLGLAIRADFIPRAPDRFALMVLGDCMSCQAHVLVLRRFKHETPRFIITTHKELVKSLSKEWPGVPVVLDEARRILPEYCYSITPQLMLIDRGRITDASIGAMDCQTKWESWNR